MKRSLLGIMAVAAISFTACKKSSTETTKPVVYPDMAEASDPALLFTTTSGVKVFNGGFGSSVAADPNDPNVFYLMTDRGPNVAGTMANSIILSVNSV